MIKEHNANPDRTFDLAINKFADRHSSERNFGFKAPDLKNAKLTTSQTPDFKSMITSNDVNWNTTTKYLAPVRDQGGCGSCWAHSTIESFESALAIKNKQDLKSSSTYRLSIQYLVDCDTLDWGCNGGFMD